MLLWKQQQALQIGRNIRERRKQLGLSQSAVADGLFSVQSMSLIERGKLNVAPETLAILATRLECQVEDLLQMKDLQEEWLEELLQTALHFHESNQLANALEILHTLYTESLASNNMRYLSESCYHLCVIYNATAKYTVSNEWGEEAMKMQIEHMPLDRILTLYTTLGHNYYNLGQMWEAFELLQQAERLVEPLQTTEQTGRLYSSMAIIKQTLQNWEGCIWYCERALQIFEQNDMIIYIGRTLMMMGTAYKNQERYDKAYNHLDRAIRILSQTSDALTHARCYHNLGELEWKMGQFDKARKSFLRSLKLKRQAKDYETLQNTLRALAKLSLQEEKFEESRLFLEECLERSTQLDSPLQLAITWRHMGDLALAQHDEDQFITLYKKAIDSFEKVGFSIEIAEAAEKLGEYFLQKNKERYAIPYLQKANHHYRKLLKKS